MCIVNPKTLHYFFEKIYTCVCADSLIDLRKGADTMPISEAKKRANKKWNEANMNKLYDRGNVLFPKGKKEEIQAHAADMGESLNAFVNRAVTETMERDKEKANE